MGVEHVLPAAAVAAFAVAWGVTWLCCRPGSWLYFLDHPNARSLHVRPTPRTGGVGVMAGIAAAALVTIAAGGAGRALLAALGGAFVLAGLGLADDRAGLSARLRLLAQLLVAGGFLCCYVATATQMGRIMDTVRAHGGFTEPVMKEHTARDWHAEGLAIRPGHGSTGHTGFLITSRRLAPGVEAQMRKRRPAPGAYGPDYVREGLYRIVDGRGRMGYADEKGRVVIFGAGMGLPYFSTDTTAAQRALEIKAEVVLMAKAVDGVFTADPREDPEATMFTEISHREVLEQGLKVADATAFSLCMDNKMPMLVFNLLTEGNIARAIAGERIGTLVTT